MCSDTKSVLDSLEDFILNQDKIVTYRWLSKKLNIHTNTSKQLLYTFCQKNSDEKLLVTYLITGKTNDGIKVNLVGESDVDKVKNELEKVLSEHVYSVQRASSLSTSDLYLADSTAQNSENSLSSILPKQLEEREFKVALTDKPPATSTSNQFSKIQQNVSAKTSLFSNKANSVQSKAKEESEKPEKGIKEATSKQSEKETIPASKISKDVKIVSPTKNIKKKATQQSKKLGNIGSFFNYQNVLNAEKKKNEPVCQEPENITQEKTSDKIQTEAAALDVLDVSAVFSDDEHTEKSVKTPKNNKKRKEKSRSRNIKRKNKNDDDNTPAKRRKRIVLASDSDSTSEEEMDVEEEPLPESDRAPPQVSDSDEEVIPPTPFGEKAKKRIRKQVDKTFVDEDGFVVTKKEFVYECCSDSDKEKEPTKENVNVRDGFSKISNKSTKDNPSTEEQVNESKEKTKAEEKDKFKGEEEDNSTVKGKSKKSKLETKDKGKSKNLQKTSPNAVNRQASITSFFKRK